MKAKLETLSVSVLREFAKDKNIKNISAMRKSELIEAIIAAAEGEEKNEPAEVASVVAEDEADVQNTHKTSEYSHQKSEQYVKEEHKENYHAQSQRGQEQPKQEQDMPMADGILEVLSEGYGFIRCENFLPGENDVYVSPSQIRKFNLKTGDIIQGPRRMKTSGEKFSALMYLESVNGKDPSVAQRRPAFESLTPIFPNERIHLEKNSATVAMRMVDLISPIGKGQRGMIVSQPKSGKTTLLKQIANAVTKNNPEMHIMILLIDERPEEVTDIKESIVGDNVEVIYSTFDELPERHKRVSEMVIERAKRLVEQKTDVIILLDSITRLARAYNLTVQASGRTLSGGLDPAALHMPKRFFGAARNMREGGSLTILATALVETGSKMDDVVFEEFKGTGNMELVLDRKLSEKRVFPAIDIAKSSTRREDLLLNKEEQEAVDIMRKALNGLKTDEAAERILDLFVKTKNNEELVRTVIKNHYI
ncbi:MAG: transcription termination factor Rho [Eubacterium sp.]|nr:transcription termination factor Rho [Eubacterium sp.]